nr:hypothetical protein [Deinococcus sp.]
MLRLSPVYQSPNDDTYDISDDLVKTRLSGRDGPSWTLPRTLPDCREPLSFQAQGAHYDRASD